MTSTKRRRRRTNERSDLGQGHRPTAKELRTSEKSSSLANSESDPKRTDSSVSEVLGTDDGVQATEALLQSQIQMESESVELVQHRKPISSENKVLEEIQTSSAGQVQSTADSERCTLGSSLTRGNSAATAGKGKAAPRIKKKVAPKVVSSRPKRVTTSSPTVVAEGCAQTSSPDSSLQKMTHRTEKPSDTGDQTARNLSGTLRGDCSPPYEAQIHEDSEEVALSGASSLITSNTLTNPTSDEVISNTLNEVLRNTHSQEPEDIGLAGIVPSRLGLPGDDLHGDAILIAAQQDNHAEIELRSENADVSSRTDERTTHNVVSMVNSEEDSFVYQTCTAGDEQERTSKSPQSTNKTGQTSQSCSPQSKEKVSQTSSPTSTDKNRQTSQSTSLQSTDKPDQTSQSSSPQLTNKASQTSVSSSPSSSQEPQSTRSRRSGSVDQRSRRSQSRASSVGSEAGGKESSSPEQTGSKSKKRQRVSHCNLYTQHVV